MADRGSCFLPDSGAPSPLFEPAAAPTQPHAGHVSL